MRKTVQSHTAEDLWLCPKVYASVEGASSGKDSHYIIDVLFQMSSSLG